MVMRIAMQHANIRRTHKVWQVDPLSLPWFVWHKHLVYESVYVVINRSALGTVSGNLPRQFTSELGIQSQCVYYRTVA
jgi:hypothetical protein